MPSIAAQEVAELVTNRCDVVVAIRGNADQTAMLAVALVVVSVGTNARELVVVRTPADADALDRWITEQLAQGHRDSPRDIVGCVNWKPERKREAGDQEAA